MYNKVENLVLRPAGTEKGARRYMDIVRAGAIVLMHDGFAALSKRKIAARLGISDSSVSYHFPDIDALWQAVIAFEVQEHYRKHYHGLVAWKNDPDRYFNEYLDCWIAEYRDPELRMFFSQFLAFAEVNKTAAELRDAIYEKFLQDTIDAAIPIVPPTPRAELEQRVLTVMAMLEGLQTVTAFRPGLLHPDHLFRQRLKQTIKAIIRGQQSEL